jgi:hypothetical protein
VQKETIHYTAASGFLFLRFFCPAILAVRFPYTLNLFQPKLFKLTCDSPPTDNTGRLLLLITKIMQNLSNLIQFQDGGKELFMIPCDSFITANIPKFKEFIDRISVSLELISNILVQGNITSRFTVSFHKHRPKPQRLRYGPGTRIFSHH